MRSKTSCFNLHLMGHMTRRYWPIWALYALAMFLIGPAYLLGMLSAGGGYRTPLYIFRDIAETAIYGGTLINLIFASGIALAVFSTLYKTESAVMEATLPIDRRSRYFSSFVVGLVWMLAVNVVMFLLMILFQLVYSTVYMPVMWLWLGMMCLECIIFYCIAALGAMFTGKLLIAVGIVAFLNFASVIFHALITSVLDIALWGYSGSGTAEDVMMALSPAARLLSNYGISLYNPDGITPWSYSASPYHYSEVIVRFDGWGYLVGCAVICLLLAVAAYFFYRRRALETAGETISVGFLRPVFVALATLFCALGLGVIFYSLVFTYSLNRGSPSAALALGACMLVGAFIGYVLGLMILRRSFRVWRSLPKFAIPAVVVVVFTVLCATGMLGWSTWTPKADKVESVTVWVGGDSNTLYADDDIAAFLRVHETFLQQCDANYDGDCYSYMTISYRLTNGVTTDRYFKLPLWEEPTDASYMLQELLNQTHLVMDRAFLSGDPIKDVENRGNVSARFHTEDTSYELYYSVLTSDQVWDLLTRGVIPDIQAGSSIGQVDLSYITQGYGAEYYEYIEKFGITSEVGVVYGDKNLVPAEGIPVKLEPGIVIELDMRYCIDGGGSSWIYIHVDETCLNTLAILRGMGIVE